MSQIDLMFLVHDMSMSDEQDNVDELQDMPFHPGIDNNRPPSIYISLYIVNPWRSQPRNQFSSLRENASNSIRLRIGVIPCISSLFKLTSA